MEGLLWYKNIKKDSVSFSFGDILLSFVKNPQNIKHNLNTFHATGLLLYPLKILDIIWGHRSKRVG